MKYLINIVSDFIASDFLSIFNTRTPVQSDHWINLNEDKKEDILQKIKSGVIEDDDFICIIN